MVRFKRKKPWFSPCKFSLSSTLNTAFRSISRHQTHLKPALQILLPSLCSHRSSHQLQLLQMQRNNSRKVMKILNVALLMGCNSWNKDLTQLGEASFSSASERTREQRRQAFHSDTTVPQLRQSKSIPFGTQRLCPSADSPANSNPTGLTPR